MENDTYTYENTSHEEIRLIFCEDVYIGYYNPLLDHVLDA